MRILHVSTRMILGGSQENTVLSCEEQSRRGHSVHLAFGPIYGPEGSLLERVEAFTTTDGREVTTHEVDALVREVHPLKDAVCLRELAGLIRRLEPDVVHTHSSKAGVLGRWAAWRVMGERMRGRRKRPMGVVHTIHGPSFHEHQSWMVREAYVRAERFAARRCHVMVSVADAMTRAYLARGVGRAEQYLTVRSGMEVERFVRARAGESREDVRAELGFSEGNFVVGTVARLAELKGHDDLLDALGAELHNRPNWRLLWVGDGWWRGRLEARVRSMGLSDRVVVAGLVPTERVPAMMRAMDVLAHPSYREGLPRTVPQALLCGVAAVAYDVDGTGEVCVDGETGRLVRAGDKPGLREAIVWLHDHPAERVAMGARGRERCEREFSVTAMADGLEVAYANALDRCGAGLAGVRVGAGA